MANKYLKPKQKSFKPIIIVIVFALIIVSGLLMFFFSKGMKKPDTIVVGSETQQSQTAETLEVLTVEAGEMEGLVLLLPWEAEGAKQPAEYTLEEYEGLTAEQRKAFLNYLGAADYAAWLERAEAEADKNVVIPWKESGAKQPEKYTWAEFQALTERQQKAFQEALGPQGLEAWLEKVQGGSGTQSGSSSQSGSNSQSGGSSQGGSTSQSGGSTQGADNTPGVKGFYPWEKAGAKKAENYTLEDFVQLSPVQQLAFQQHLGKGYESWLKKAREAEYPWLAAGAKQPKDYTWEEYAALSAGQKKEFQNTLGAADFQKWQNNVLNQDLNYPWKESGAKQPDKYTWAEYEKLTQAQQVAFQVHLGENAMKAWLKTITDIPWEVSKAKQPEKYTLKEYEALKAPQQLAFQIYMGMEDFSAWMLEAKNPIQANPWENAGAKQPKDYTWEEYSKLTAAQQMAFQNNLGTEGFENWMKKAEGKPAANPWDASGAKQPKDYTLKEFNALTEAQQMAFQNHLGSTGFADWLNKVQEKPAGIPVVNPWDASGAKQPKDYTWAEFNALTAAQQMAFQNHLGSAAFETWLNKAQEKPAEIPEVNPWDASGAKQPRDYTLEEFNALTAAQQMAFQKHLGSDFEAWLSKAQEKPVVNPWDASGAKQPNDYTMEEFNALTGAQQMAFQKYLGSDFEAWLNKVLEKPAVEQPTEESAEQPAAASMDNSDDSQNVGDYQGDLEETSAE